MTIRSIRATIVVLRHYIDSESVDLIYLDPPFNSNANYTSFSRAQGRGGGHPDRGVEGHLARRLRGYGDRGYGVTLTVH
jgi:hypothetical protein